MDEPSLLIDSSSLEIYRFTFIRSHFDDFSNRLEKHHDSVRLHLKMLKYGCSARAHALKRVDYSTIIQPSDWSDFKRILNNSEFWELSIRPYPNDKIPIFALDSDQWLFEGKLNNIYDVMYSECSDGSRMNELRKFVLSLVDYENLRLQSAIDEKIDNFELEEIPDE